MYEVITSKLYRKQYKKISVGDRALINQAVKILANGETLEPRYKDHPLIGNYTGFRECHIKPDLLLVYAIRDDVLELYLAATGSHSELFNK
jgi:addiction module toxin, relE/stbE family